ncbi:hypothetical protein C8F01DRAFT_581985 [Mycena amicta]|nr:hypothetical protein C8F01DRAFT_581985 [Mycena amicta]
MFTNINDSAGLTAILDRLRASQAWQNINASPSHQQQTAEETPPTASVATLLSQLNPVEPPQTVFEPPPNPIQTTESPAVAAPEDVRFLTFQQALPRLAQLSDDAVSAIEQLRQDQDKLERALWAERVALREKYETKVEVAKHKELKQFDSERALPAWDALVARQQTALAALGIPAMYPTAEKSDRELQQRVVQVLEGIVSSSDSMA